MNSTAYAHARRARGTQAEVAKALGLTKVTLSRRERGVTPLSREMSLALAALPPKYGVAQLQPANDFAAVENPRQ